MMTIAGHIGPSRLDELEHRRHRLTELLDLGLVSITLVRQLHKSVAEIDAEIATLRGTAQPLRLAA